MYNMKPLTIEQVKSTVKDNDFVWLELFGEHYNCEFNDLFCLRVRFIKDEYIEFCTIWDEMAVDFSEYGETWYIYAENPEPYGWTDD